ncbi:MAG: protein kinase [Gemmatimonadaceae bacterium]
MDNLSRVGKYEIQALVGEGAMGVVYRALDPMLNRSVAVKVMNDALALDEDFRTRFLREARAAGSLQHPNVITVYDCGETDGHLYIAMEFVEGADLEQVIASKIPLTLREKLDLVIGVLNGLGYAHKRGIVHRDMKPENIRVNDDGRALIMDFGIAHTTSSNVTRTGLVLGTPNYMAPEQVTGGEITPQTDIFSVGVVLYELLTNAKPFEGSTLHSVLFKIVGEMPTPPDKIVTGLRADLSEVVMKALAKDPADRFASTAEMANALSKISTSLSGYGAPAASRTLSLRSSIDVALHNVQEAEKRADSRRMWRHAAVAAGVVAVLLGGTTFALTGSHRMASLKQVTVQQTGTPVIAAPPASAPVNQPSPAPPEASAPVKPTASAKAATMAPDAARLRETARAHDAGVRAAAAVADSVRTSRPEPSSVPAVSPPRERIVSAPVVSAIPSAPTAPPANPSADIADVVAQYARAIESRDVSALRRLYPGMTSAQASSFDDFFRSVSSLRASLAMSNLQVDGSSATAVVSGAYDFSTSNGRSEHQPLTLQVQLRRDGSTWRFVSIR